MSNSLYDFNVRLLREITTDSQLYADHKRARTGKYNAAGTAIDSNPRTGLDGAHIWVRIENDRNAVPALIGQIRSDLANMPVWVGLNKSGERVAFIQIVDEETANVYSSHLPGLGVPNTPIEARNDPLPHALLQGGRVLPSTDGGLVVYVEPYPAAGYYLSLAAGAHEVDLTASVPSASNQRRWAVFYIDDAGVVQVIDDAVTTSALTVAGAFAVFLPTFAYPLAALSLRTGQTEAFDSTTQLVDLRRHHERKPLTFEQIMTDANGNVMVDANGHVMYGE